MDSDVFFKSHTFYILTVSGHYNKITKTIKSTQVRFADNMKFY